MTQFKDRCGDCGRFPGNGNVCTRRRGGMVTRSVVYKLDNGCEAFEAIEREQILRFFSEHPVHEFSIATMSEYLGLEEEVVKKNLKDLVNSGHITGHVRSTAEGRYKLRLDAETVERLTEEAKNMGE